MIINTNTQKLKDYRKIRLEQLLSDHNAVNLAIGSWGATPIQFEGVWMGIQYLEQNAKGIEGSGMLSSMRMQRKI
ncbi:MAG: hypothetical protein JJE49_03295 [Peptostreptococcaceae bacterium]|nr:hypothetical protein [Peptostreptococcaceae bacterium]